MTVSYLKSVTLAVVLSMSSPLALYAQSNGEGEEGSYYGEGGEGGEDIGDRSGKRGRASTTPPATTASVVTSIEATSAFCSAIAGAYTVDCLSERLGDLAEELEGQEGFEDAQAILEDTSRKLNQIARQNRSTTEGPARFSSQGQTPVTTTRRLVPVDEASRQEAASQALAVIAEAETLLLRSAEESGERAVQYQRIASALGSNKVLLRSV